MTFAGRMMRFQLGTRNLVFVNVQGALRVVVEVVRMVRIQVLDGRFVEAAVG